MRARRLVLAIAVVALGAREASGDVWHLKSPSEVVTEKGSKVSLPAGWFLDEKTWQERDAELKEAQRERTRLKAENESLRKSANEGHPWVASGLLVTIVAGIVYGLAK